MPPRILYYAETTYPVLGTRVSAVSVDHDAAVKLIKEQCVNYAHQPTDAEIMVYIYSR